MRSDSYFENNCSNDPAGSSSKHDDLKNNDRHLGNVGSKTDQEIGYSVDPSVVMYHKNPAAIFSKGVSL